MSVPRGKTKLYPTRDELVTVKVYLVDGSDTTRFWDPTVPILGRFFDVFCCHSERSEEPRERGEYSIVTSRCRCGNVMEAGSDLAVLASEAKNPWIKRTLATNHADGSPQSLEYLHCGCEVPHFVRDDQAIIAAVSTA